MVIQVLNSKLGITLNLNKICFKLAWQSQVKAIKEVGGFVPLVSFMNTLTGNVNLFSLLFKIGLKQTMEHGS